jgi:hypothetical protein
MSSKKPMNKWLLYTIFVVKFLSGLGLIVWTVYMTMQSDVGDDEDNAFLSTYHNIDTNYNNIVIANTKINSKYLIEFKFNEEIIDGISHEDVFLAQRAIANRKNRKNILKLGENSFSVNIKTKEGHTVDNAKIKMLVTMATNHKYDKNLEFIDTNREVFNINKIGYWNITGTVKIDNYEGHFFIKTNAR